MTQSLKRHSTSELSIAGTMVSYAKYSLVPTDEPDKAAAALSGATGKVTTPTGGPTSMFGNIFSTTHKPPSCNQSTLPHPPNSAFDYSSAFNFKSAFDYTTGSPNQYKSAFDYGYSRKETGDGLNRADAASRRGLWPLKYIAVKILLGLSSRYQVMTLQVYLNAKLPISSVHGICVLIYFTKQFY